MYRNKSITVIIPALNEEPSIAKVITELSALHVCKTCGFSGEYLSQINNEFLTEITTSSYCEICSDTVTRVPLVDNIIVCDNGSSDNTAAISKTCGAIVIEELEKGYGAACLAAMSYPLEKELIVFVDGDHSVVCNEMPTLLDPLFSGADLVIGSRTLGKCDIGALSFPQRLGNRFASALLRIIWKQQVTDLGPFRAISSQAYDQLKMQDRQFGWTVEMQVRALQQNKVIEEIPVSTRIRIGQSKISGTVRGVIGASKGILGTIAKLYCQELISKYSNKFTSNRKRHQMPASPEERHS